MPSNPHWIAIAILAALPSIVAAQDRPKPDEANAPTIPLQYDSAFAAYQAAGDLALTPDKNWRAVNDQVGRLGGHMGSIKDAPATTAPAAVKSTPEVQQTAPAPASPHLHHKSPAQ